MSNPGREADVAVEDGDTEQETTLLLCGECCHDFGDTAGVSLSRNQCTDERNDT